MQELGNIVLLVCSLVTMQLDLKAELRAIIGMQTWL